MNQPTEPATKRIAFTVSGQVQGVNFRSFTQKKATALGITGWVRNTRDGKVEGEAQGDICQIDRLREELKNGPFYARVVGYEELDLECKRGGVVEGEFRVLR